MGAQSSIISSLHHTCNKGTCSQLASHCTSTAGPDLTVEQFYSRTKEVYDEYMSRLGASYTSEIVQVGGAEGVGSLKFSVQAYASRVHHCPAASQVWRVVHGPTLTVLNFVSM